MMIMLRPAQLSRLDASALICQISQKLFYS
jgi:hypothetical protein